MVKSRPFEAAALIVAAMGAAATGPSALAAEGYPSRPLRIIVAFSPGGPTDLVARLLAQGLSESMGQQALVDNRPGAGGTVAGPIIARAAPDGHTLFTAANGEVAIAPHLYAKLPWNPATDIAPVSRVGVSQLLLVVPAASPAATVKDLIALARARPGPTRARGRRWPNSSPGRCRC
jgi:tripartite-type tricarboxylate transporter receptor subunit TctC